MEVRSDSEGKNTGDSSRCDDFSSLNHEGYLKGIVVILSKARGDAVGGDKDLIVAVQQVLHGLIHAHMRLHTDKKQLRLSHGARFNKPRCQTGRWTRHALEGRSGLAG